MTASSTWRSRGVSSSGLVISLNMLTTSAMRQGSGESVEPQPAERSAPKSAVLADGHPSCDFPLRHRVTLVCAKLEATIAPHCQIHRLGRSVGVGERLLPLPRVRPGHDELAPGRVGTRVPAPDRAVESVS